MEKPNPIEVLKAEGLPFWERLTTPPDSIGTGRPLPMKTVVWTFIVLGLILTAHSTSEASLSWMYIFNKQDFNGLGDLLTWLWDLQTGIPPVLGSLDVISYWLTGDFSLTVVVFYRLAFIGMFVLSFSLFSRTPLRFWLSVLLALVFLWAGVKLPAPKIQAYDIYFPFCFLLFLHFLTKAKDPESSEKQKRIFVVVSGLMLTMSELLRPFMIFILPFLLWQVWLALKELPRKYFWFFLIPVLVFSGGWHAKHLFMYGQVAWTNHSGYNLHRAWIDIAPMPELEPEEAGANPEGPPNINTEVHGRNSRKIRNEVMKAIYHHPGRSIVNVFKQTGKLFKPETAIYEMAPEHFIFGPYKPAVWLSALILFVNFISFLLLLVFRRVNWRWLGRPEIILLLFTLFEAFIIAIGDSGEEARFLLSMLPFLAALPGLSISWQLRKEVVEMIGSKASGAYRQWRDEKIDE